MARPHEKEGHQATSLIKRFDELTCYRIGQGGKFWGWEYLPDEGFSPEMQEELMNLIRNPSFDKYHIYISSCSCGCGVSNNPQDSFEYASIRPEALDFLRNEGFYDGEEEFLMNAYYQLIQHTGVANLEGQGEKINILIDYMWDWMCSIDEKLILDYSHPDYNTSILHSILYGHNKDKIDELTDRFLDLWDKHYPDKPLPEAIQDDAVAGEDPQTIEYLLTREVMSDQLRRVMSREAYTSAHLRWTYNEYDNGLIGMKTWLVSLRDDYKEGWRNTYDDCIRMLEEKGGMPSEVDQSILDKIREKEAAWKARLNEG